MKERWNVYVGGTTGVFKGLKIAHNGLKKMKNIVDVTEATNKKEITCMNWSMSDNSQIVMGYCDQTVRLYDTSASGFVFDNKLDCGQGSVIGISSRHNLISTGAKSGELKFWSMDGEDVKESSIIQTGGELDKMCHCKFEPNRIATGGRENDLKLWDVETRTSTFTAKNVRPDELQLRVPVWVSDITFMADCPKVAVASRHGFVRLYDPNSQFRRPVINLKIPDQALTCISTAPRENHVLVGSGTGNMFLVDLRSKGLLLNHYKGFVGGIRQIACPIAESVVVSVGLDRHIRVHDLNSKQLLLKEYLQSRLSSVLLTQNFTMTKVKEEEDDDLEIKVEKDVDCTIKKEDGDEELDALFDGMETVSDKKKPRKEHNKPDFDDDIQVSDCVIKKRKVFKKTKTIIDNGKKVVFEKNVKKKMK